MTKEICKTCIHWGNEFKDACKCEVRDYYTMFYEDCDEWEGRHD